MMNKINVCALQETIQVVLIELKNTGKTFMDLFGEVRVIAEKGHPYLWIVMMHAAIQFLKLV